MKDVERGKSLYLVVKTSSQGNGVVAEGVPACCH